MAESLVDHLVVGQVAVLFGTLASRSGSVGGASNLVGVGVDEFVRSAIGGDAQDQLVSGGSGLDVELDGRVLERSEVKLY